MHNTHQILLKNNNVINYYKLDEYEAVESCINIDCSFSFGTKKNISLLFAPYNEP